MFCIPSTRMYRENSTIVVSNNQGIKDFVPVQTVLADFTAKIISCGSKF